MELYRYRFSLITHGSVRFPTFPGVPLRGGLGTVLYQWACRHRELSSCVDCPVAARCPYPPLFRPFAELFGLPYKRYRDLPPPFVIRPRFGQGTYGPRGSLDFDLVLVGAAERYLPFVYVAFSELGRLGIGSKRPGRGDDGRFSVASVEAISPSGERAFLQGAGGFASPAEPWRFPADFATSSPAVSNGAFTLEFATPTFVAKGCSARGSLEFVDMLSALLRRASLLSQAFCSRPAFTREEELSALRLAAAVSIGRREVTWDAVPRRSARQNREMVFGGWTGRVEYVGPLTPFLPLIRLAEMIHVGKHPAFGWGAVRLAALNAPHSDPHP